MRQHKLSLDIRGVLSCSCKHLSSPLVASDTLPAASQQSQSVLSHRKTTFWDGAAIQQCRLMLCPYNNHPRSACPSWGRIASWRQAWLWRLQRIRKAPCDSHRWSPQVALGASMPNLTPADAEPRERIWIQCLCASLAGPFRRPLACGRRPAMSRPLHTNL